MGKVAVVYWSGSGHTAAMAKEIAAGAEAAGTEVSLFTATEFSPVEAAGFDKIAFGCSAMGAEELEETEFLPMFEAVEPSLSGKLVALFGSYGWGDGEWMKNWEARIRAQGRLFAEGLILNEAPDAEGLEKCRAFGCDFGGR